MCFHTVTVLPDVYCLIVCISDRFSVCRNFYICFHCLDVTMNFAYLKLFHFITVNFTFVFDIWAFIKCSLFPFFYQLLCFAQLNEFIFQAFGVKQLIASAYHPQTNGQDERTNQTLKKALAKYTNDEQSDWDKLVFCVYINCREFNPWLSLHGTSDCKTNSLTNFWE